MTVKNKKPLTDYMLKELGFTYSFVYDYQKDIEINWWFKIDGNFVLQAVREKGEEEYKVVFINIPDSPVYKTVGSVRMLINIIKGDEK